MTPPLCDMLAFRRDFVLLTIPHADVLDRYRSPVSSSFPAMRLICTYVAFGALNRLCVPGCHQNLCCGYTQARSFEYCRDGERNVGAQQTDAEPADMVVKPYQVCVAISTARLKLSV